MSFAVVCKICVSIFAFVSGYGLFLNYQKNDMADDRWAMQRLVKTFSGFWPVWILSAIITNAIDGKFTWFFVRNNVSSIWETVFYAILVFLGLSGVFDTPTLNGTWWYMSAAFFFIIIVPLVMRHRDYLIGIILFVVFINRVIHGDSGEGIFTGETSIWTFLTPFLIGMLFARHDLIERIVNSRGRIFRLITWPLLMFLSYKAYMALPVKEFWELHYGVMPLFLILFCVEFVATVPGVRQLLAFLGKHSMNIFITHTFFRLWYLHDFLYSQKNFLLTLIYLLLVSLCVSIVLEWLKKISRYNQLIDNDCRCISKTKQSTQDIEKLKA